MQNFQVIMKVLIQIPFQLEKITFYSYFGSCIAEILYNSIQSNQPVESILLIDELDATLHPSLQFKLLDLFNQYSHDYKIQIFITTHSLSLIEHALEKNIMLFT